MKASEIHTALDAAMWVTASPHEWSWSPEQQIAMARYCVTAGQVLRESLSDLEQIVVTDGQDRGVILLSIDAPSEYDPEAGCHVYKHENFSPLGDALITLYERLKTMQDHLKADDKPES